MLIIPENYEAALGIRETEVAIKKVKDFFQQALAANLNLARVTAPLFLAPESGLNDNLNGVERPVSFGIKEQGDREVEIVHSLAKWKRFALKRYGFAHGEGLYTDMNAIRRDEDTDNIHSIFVDQWDWERVINKEERNTHTLKEIVKKVYQTLQETEDYMSVQYNYIEKILPQNITFVTTQELEDLYPDKTAKEREYIAAKQYGAIFLMQIGDKLKSGEPHDGRAPDYDDYTSTGLNNLPGLNGDLLLWDDVLQRSIELSSMGVRVDREALQRQLKEENEEERLKLYFHKRLMDDTLPLSIGGGIGQSRLCMFYLRKAHIGEIQASIWPEDMRKECEELDIHLI